MLGRLAYTALAATALSAILVPAPAAAQATDRAAPKTGTLGSFTPAGTRAKGESLSARESSFSFTPAGKTAGKRKGVTVGVTSRIVQEGAKPSPTAVTAARARTAKPAREVEAKLDVGYKGFSLSGGVARQTDAFEGSEREGAEVGFAYGTKKWRAAVEAGATVAADGSRIIPDKMGNTEHIELGGAYALSPRLSVRGGVRYDRLHPEAYGRDFVNKDADKAEESGTVYLGTSISF
ncbi:MAG: porin [Pacificimonas sp.]